MAAKKILFRSQARDKILRGAAQLADAVRITLGDRSASLAILEDVAIGKGPAQCLIAAGYAGWGPGQLESELAAGAWEVIDGDAALLFDGDVDGKWQRALERRGVDL